MLLVTLESTLRMEAGCQGNQRAHSLISGRKRKFDHHDPRFNQPCLCMKPPQEAKNKEEVRGLSGGGARVLLVS